jgi:hypothetical protein
MEKGNIEMQAKKALCSYSQKSGVWKMISAENDCVNTSGTLCSRDLDEVIVTKTNYACARNWNSRLESQTGIREISQMSALRCKSESNEVSAD